MVEPREVLPRTVGLIEQGMAERLHVGAQVYIALGGELVADFGVGAARPGVPMTPDTIMLWRSSTKPVAAVAIAQLWEQGELELDDRVAAYIPEFGAHGKEGITIRHLLTHTGGFRVADTGTPATPWQETIARICAARPERDWIPGRKAGYHLATSWFVLGELVRRIDGRPFERYIREEIFEPLGMMDSWVGMPPERYRAYGDRIGIMHDTTGDEPHPRDWDTEEQCAWVVPGGSGRGSMRELARFYQMLLGRGQLGRARILSPQAVEAITARHRAGMFDHTFKHVMDWGLGVILDSNQYGADTVPYGYGRHCSPRTFGHSGSQSSTGFCDPEYALVVALVFNGTPGEVRHNARIRAIATAIYEDLGLTS
jgi:CubicO group peptidase (beta-lactamase class C family)